MAREGLEMIYHFLVFDFCLLWPSRNSERTLLALPQSGFLSSDRELPDIWGYVLNSYNGLRLFSQSQSH